jgi:hypothetical protein
MWRVPDKASERSVTAVDIQYAIALADFSVAEVVNLKRRIRMISS